MKIFSSRKANSEDQAVSNLIAEQRQKEAAEVWRRVPREDFRATVFPRLFSRVDQVLEVRHHQFAAPQNVWGSNYYKP